MTPKIIHLCWFSNDPFPVEIKICLESWKRVLPDFKVRRWTMEDARAIGCRYINEALDARKWAFATDVVRFYSVWKEGGVYMDSDMFVKKRFDQYMPEHGFASFHEHISTNVKLQAAFFMGEQGNQFCKEVFDYYNSRPFRLPDGSFDLKISPDVMVEIARTKGYRSEDVEQHLADDVVIYPGYLVTPCNTNTLKHPDAFAKHKVYGSWKHHKLGRRFERFMKHIVLLVRFMLLHR